MTSAVDLPRPRAVIGRTAELEAIRRLLSSSPEAPRLLVLQGDPGIGKTVLLREAVREARDSSYRVLLTQPGESDAKPSYGGLIDLLGQELQAVRSDLPPPQRTILEVALMQRSGKVEQPGGVAVAALSALQALASRSPLLVAIDDFQWLDAPSKRVMLYIARRLEPGPIALLATERVPGELGSAPGEHASVLELGPFTPASLHHLLRQRLGVTLERPLLGRLVHACGGNPLYALEIVGSLAADGREDEQLAAMPIPRSLRALVAERLGRLTPAGQEAVLVAYGLARPTAELIEQALLLSELPAEGLAEAFAGAALEPGGVVRLGHPLLGSVLYAELPPSRRRALHARLAKLPLEPEEQAHHLALASSGADPGAAAAIEAAAEVASSRGAPETAGELFDLAVELTPAADQPGRLSRLDRAAMAYFRAGDSPKAVERWEEIVRVAPAGLLRAHALWQLAENGAATVAGGFNGVSDLLARSAVEAGDSPALNALIEATLATHLLWGQGPMAAEPHARASLLLAERSHDPYALMQALSISALVDFVVGKGMSNELFDRAERIESEGLEVIAELLPSTFRAWVLVLSRDRLAEAEAVLTQRLEQSIRNRDVASLPTLYWQLCTTAIGRGDLSAAATHAANALEAVETSGRGGRQGLALYCQGLVAAHKGGVEEALDLGRAALELDEGERRVVYLLALHRGLLGFAELSRARPEAALDWLEPARRALMDQGYKEPGLYGFIPDEVEVLVLLGRLDEAEAVLTPFEESGARLGRRWAIATAARCRGLLLAARGDTTAGLLELARCVRASEQLGQPFELARALLAQGIVARRAKKKRAAEASLLRAEELFSRLGNPCWAERANAERGRIGLRQTPAGELTESERRVAELAAAGRRNKEIAAELFLSVRAVEANLTRAYRKLRIRSRSELAASLAAILQSGGFPH